MYGLNPVPKKLSSSSQLLSIYLFFCLSMPSLEHCTMAWEGKKANLLIKASSKTQTPSASTAQHSRQHGIVWGWMKIGFFSLFFSFSLCYTVCTHWIPVFCLFCVCFLCFFVLRYCHYCFVVLHCTNEYTVCCIVHIHSTVYICITEGCLQSIFHYGLSFLFFGPTTLLHSVVSFLLPDSLLDSGSLQYKKEYCTRLHRTILYLLYRTYVIRAFSILKEIVPTWILFAIDFLIVTKALFGKKVPKVPNGQEKSPLTLLLLSLFPKNCVKLIYTIPPPIPPPKKKSPDCPKRWNGPKTEKALSLSGQKVYEMS